MRVSTKKIAEAIQQHIGTLTFVADEVGLSLEALELRIAKSEKLRRAMRHVGERILDGSVRLVYNDIIEFQNVDTAMWLLEQQGQARGFGRGARSAADHELRAFVMKVGGDDLETLEEMRRIAEGR